MRRAAAPSRQRPFQGIHSAPRVRRGNRNRFSVNWQRASLANSWSARKICSQGAGWKLSNGLRLPLFKERHRKSSLWSGGVEGWWGGGGSYQGRGPVGDTGFFFCCFLAGWVGGWEGVGGIIVGEPRILRLRTSSSAGSTGGAKQPLEFHPIGRNFSNVTVECECLYAFCVQTSKGATRGRKMTHEFWWLNGGSARRGLSRGPPKYCRVAHRLTITCCCCGSAPLPPWKPWPAERTDGRASTPTASSDRKQWCTFPRPIAGGSDSWAWFCCSFCFFCFSPC